MSEKLAKCVLIITFIQSEWSKSAIRSAKWRTTSPSHFTFEWNRCFFSSVKYRS